MNLVHRSQSSLALLVGCAALALVAPGCGDDDDVFGPAGGTAGKPAGGKSGGGGQTAAGGKVSNGGTTGQGGKAPGNGGRLGAGGTGGNTPTGGITGEGGMAEGGYAGDTGWGGTTSGGAANGGKANGGSANGGSANGGTSPGTGGTTGGITGSNGGTGGTIVITGGAGGDGGMGGEGGAGNPPPQPFNLVANGDAELGDASGWRGFGHATAVSSSKHHNGSYSAYMTGRDMEWNGPALTIPAGAGTYSVSAWALQDGAAPLTLQLTAHCGGDSENYFGVQQVAAVEANTWTQFAGTFTFPANCYGGVLYLQQVGGTVYPDLYLDDVVVKAVTVPNLAGNSGAETVNTATPSAPFDWGGFNGGTLTSSVAQYHGGAKSAAALGRTGIGQGLAFAVPTGAGRYAISVWAYQTSGADAKLWLQAVTACATTEYPLLASPVVPSATWTQLSGTLTLPPGCKSVQAYVVQASDATATVADLFLDDASIVAVPQ